ncbi:hypothetical protein A45J_0400 [hot springs metagenome]|uniref:Uncharacterized protein n=1 Tax=hot springs metagenome TaxID=433727 RepID=A0A5J4L054_9ZZZZ
MAEKQIDAKYLKGLKFRTSEAKKVKEDGEEKVRHTPVERDLTTDDVLDWKDKGDSVTVVTKDGQKYNVSKTPSKTEGK